MRQRLLSLALAGLCAGVSIHAAGAVLDDVSFVRVATGVSNVVAIRHAGDGSRRLFLVLQSGTIRVVDAGGTLLTTPFLNVGSGGTAPPLGFSSGGERGLLGLAFHPLYAQNGRFYVYYTDDDNGGASGVSGNTVVAEYTVSGANPNLADAASGRVILRVYQPYSNHNGGDIHFGPDGYLYIGLGDGGDGNDPCNSGQSLTTATMNGCTASASFLAAPPSGVPSGNANSRALLGKMLRIDVDSTDTPSGADLCGADSALRTYGIPADNPFAGNAGGNADACDEIWHYGLRNPWRFSFDRDNHDLIIGDVGQSSWEELNLVPGASAGLNFGWKICEGFHVRGSTSTLCSLAGRTDPIVAYGRGVGYSIAGGWRYRGPYSELEGVVFSGDYGGAIFAITESGGSFSIAKTWSGGDVNSIVGFGEDEAGHLYAASLSTGRVLKITLPARPTDAPALSLAIATTLIDTNGNGIADAGDTLRFSYTVHNTGNIALTWIEVEDSLGNALSCTPALVHAGDAADCGQADHVVTGADVTAGEFAVTASATGTAPDGTTLVDSDEAEEVVVLDQDVVFRNGFE